MTKRSNAAGNEGSSAPPYSSFPADVSDANAVRHQSSYTGNDERQKDTGGWKETEMAVKINDALLRQIEVCCFNVVKYVYYFAFIMYIILFNFMIYCQIYGLDLLKSY